jgi:hypothetical protein
MGSKRGTLFARAGHEVIFSYSRNSKKLEHLAKEAGAHAHAGTPADATQGADAVLQTRCTTCRLFGQVPPNPAQNGEEKAHTYAKGMPPRLQRVVHRCLEKDPVRGSTRRTIASLLPQRIHRIDL